MNSNFCQQSGFLSIILIVKDILDIVMMGVPILLLVLCLFDLVKQFLYAEKKSYEIIGKRILAAVAIFLAPLFVDVLLSMMGEASFTVGACWKNANEETIATLKQIEIIEAQAQEAALKKEQERIEKENAEKKKAQQEIAKMKEEKEKDNKEDVFLKENGTDGKVTVVNGVFYKPSKGKSGDKGTKGSGPYGYNIYFYNRLRALVSAAKAKGYTIRYSTSTYGAWRPLQNQEYFYNCYKTKKCNNGNLAAKPGKSNHGWGIASDLSFGGTAAMYWAHDHAKEYGLRFSMCNNVRSKSNCKENWHIEPAVVRVK